MACLIVFVLPFAALAAQTDHGAGGGVKPGKGIYPGVMVRHGASQEYGVMYQLLSMKERSSLMKGMEDMDMPGISRSPDITNHLMVFIEEHGGKLASGTVGFLITGPDGQEQKTMTMAMLGGYGADVNFKLKGKYKIMMKAVIGDKTAIDEFIYQVK